MANTTTASSSSVSAVAALGKKAKSATTQKEYVPIPFPSSFSAPQTEKAVKALIAHHKSAKAKQEETQLISKEEHVWLIVNTKGMPKRINKKPHRIPLPHSPLPAPPATSICLISKTPQREYKDLLQAQNVGFINRVVGVEKLKGKFKPYERRRELMKEHEVFLCDEAVLDLMPKLLGKMFFDDKKTPLPVNMKRKDLKTELAKAINSTIYHESPGTSSSIRVATAAHHSTEQIVQNLLSAIPSVIAHIPEQWDNIKSIGIKTSNSIMLPIWTCEIGDKFGASRKEDTKAKGGFSKKRKMEMEDSSDEEMDGGAKKGKVAADKVVEEAKPVAEEKAAPVVQKKQSPAKKTQTESVAAATPVAASKPSTRSQATAANKKKVAPSASTPKKTVVGKKPVAKKGGKKA